MTSILELINLTISYDKKEVIRDVNLSFQENKVTALIGPSGCGKSSLLLSMNRLIELYENSYVKGKILFMGQSIHSSNNSLIDLRKKIGTIFQRPNPFPMSIRSNMEISLIEHGIKNKKERTNIIENCLKDVGLWKEVKDRLDSPAIKLSGGQKQRLCVARALALNPEILLMDEPCSSLDPLSSGVLEDLICKLKSKVTIIIVTHNLAQARRVADHVVFLWPSKGIGHVIEEAQVDTLFNSPTHHLTKSYIQGERA